MVRWWFKNHDNGTDWLGIPYDEPTGEKGLTFVDILAGIKVGEMELVGVFEVKSLDDLYPEVTKAKAAGIAAWVTGQNAAKLSRDEKRSVCGGRDSGARGDGGGTAPLRTFRPRICTGDRRQYPR